MIERCPVCRYSLQGLPAVHRCPECGFVYDESMTIWVATSRLRQLLLPKNLSETMQTLIFGIASLVWTVLSFSRFALFLLFMFLASLAHTLIVMIQFRQRPFVAISRTGISLRGDTPEVVTIPWSRLVRVDTVKIGSSLWNVSIICRDPAETHALDSILYRHAIRESFLAEVDKAIVAYHDQCNESPDRIPGEGYETAAEYGH